MFTFMFLITMHFLPEVDIFFAQIIFFTPSFPFINHSSLVALNLCHRIASGQAPARGLYPARSRELLRPELGGFYHRSAAAGTSQAGQPGVGRKNHSEHEMKLFIGTETRPARDLNML